MIMRSKGDRKLPRDPEGWEDDTMCSASAGGIGGVM